MEIKLTAVFRKLQRLRRRVVGSKHPQGTTLEVARANLKEAVEMVLQANRELAEEL